MTQALYAHMNNKRKKKKENQTLKKKKENEKGPQQTYYLLASGFSITVSKTVRNKFLLSTSTSIYGFYY
jgi:hypothetical protein